MEFKPIARERRKRKRILVRERAITVIQSRPAVLLGQIKDFSSGGLSFSYMHRDEPPIESNTLNILLPDERLHIQGLKFRTVYDSIVLNDNPFSTIIMNRRGIKFVRLSAHHKSQLENLIQLLTCRDLNIKCPVHIINSLARMPA